MPSKRTRDGTPLLSVVVIALNEAQNLPRLLRAVGEWADEILVFDSGSTDGTVELAKEAGAKESSIEINEINENPLAYLPGKSVRLQIKAIGDLENY